jgi:DNA ligase (NAD+)
MKVFGAHGFVSGSVGTLVNPDLAESLRRIAEGGRDAFYRGEIARAIVAFFQEPDNVALIRKLKAAGVETTAPIAPEGPKPLAGKTLVVTGTLPTLSREAARELIERYGGRVTSSVSKKTDYVVVGEAAGSKADDARRLGVTTLDEAGLLALVSS